MLHPPTPLPSIPGPNLLLQVLVSSSYVLHGLQLSLLGLLESVHNLLHSIWTCYITFFQLNKIFIKSIKPLKIRKNITTIQEWACDTNTSSLVFKTEQKRSHISKFWSVSVWVGIKQVGYIYTAYTYTFTNLTWGSESWIADRPRNIGCR